MTHPNPTHANAFESPNAKWAFTTRRVNRADAAGVSRDVTKAKAGDLVLARITRIGQHKKVQLAEGRYALSYVGDLVVMTCGNRYAPDQFEGLAEITGDTCHMIAGGGVVGTIKIAHGRMSKPTELQAIGLITDKHGDVINIDSYKIPHFKIPDDIIVIGVFGSSMNSGKTTAAVCLAHGLKKAGFNVEGVKATGTGAFGDFNAFQDAGVTVSDFTDAGMASTYCMSLSRIERGFESLVGAAAARGAEIVVVEIADGLFQSETQRILQGGGIKKRLNAAMFAAKDAMGAVGGVRIMRENNLTPFAISGLVTLSPLACRETRLATNIELLSREMLIDPVKLVPHVSNFLELPVKPLNSPLSTNSGSYSGGRAAA